MTQKGIQSVDRAIRLLQTLQRTPQMSLSELASAVGLIPSTALRLLTTLQRHDLIERDPASRRYQLGAGVIRLAGVDEPWYHELRARLTPRLEQLAGLVREQVAISVLDHTRQLNIAIVDGARRAPAHERCSATAEPHDNLNATAVGKILLAFSATSTADEIIRQLSFVQTAGHTITSAGALRRHLLQVRRTGYATCVDENRAGVRGIATPLLTKDNNLVAALCINGPANRLPRHRLRELLPRLRDTADDCSAQVQDLAVST